jgi:hypothetical protein
MTSFFGFPLCVAQSFGRFCTDCKSINNLNHNTAKSLFSLAHQPKTLPQYPTTAAQPRRHHSCICQGTAFVLLLPCFALLCFVAILLDLGGAGKRKKETKREKRREEKTEDHQGQRYNSKAETEAGAERGLRPRAQPAMALELSLYFLGISRHAMGPSIQQPSSTTR